MEFVSDTDFPVTIAVMPFSPQRLLDQVLALPVADAYWVAFSGGLDSLVLLHALAVRRADLPGRLGAMHVNHNLQDSAADWARQCRDHCRSLQIEYREFDVQARPQPGESPEAAARQARYRAFAAALAPNELLVTAHHQDDQAETLLLQLLRGAGPKGLAAMPMISPLGRGHLARPLLAVSRAELRAYAERESLHWIEDPSNAQLDFDRNFLRHRVLPQLRERWPAAGRVLARGAEHQAEAARLLADLAEIDLGIDLGTDQGFHTAETLVCPQTISGLLALSPPRRANLLRHWLHRCGAPVPSTAVLMRIDQDVLRAAADAEPLVQWGGVVVRRYRDRLFLDNRAEVGLPDAPPDWPAEQALSLAGGVLTPVPGVGRGVAMRHLHGKRLRVAFRQGGERLQPAGRREHHSLKHLFQEAGVPPWERERVPLLFLDDALIAVAGYWVCEGFQALGQEPGMSFAWSRAIVPDGSIW